MTDNILDFPATQRRFSQEQLDQVRKEGAIAMQRRCVVVLEGAREEMRAIAKVQQNPQCVDAVMVGVISRVTGIGL